MFLFHFLSPRLIIFLSFHSQTKTTTIVATKGGSLLMQNTLANPPLSEEEVALRDAVKAAGARTRSLAKDNTTLRTSTS